MLSYEDALKKWGAKLLREHYPDKEFDADKVVVLLDIESDVYGCPTCGPDSPYVEADISVRTEYDYFYLFEEFRDPTEIVRGVVEAGQVE